MNTISECKYKPNKKPYLSNNKYWRSLKAKSRLRVLQYYPHQRPLKMLRKNFPLEKRHSTLRIVKAVRVMFAQQRKLLRLILQLRSIRPVILRVRSILEQLRVGKLLRSPNHVHRLTANNNWKLFKFRLERVMFEVRWSSVCKLLKICVIILIV